MQTYSEPICKPFPVYLGYLSGDDVDVLLLQTQRGHICQKLSSLLYLIQNYKRSKQLNIRYRLFKGHLIYLVTKQNLVQAEMD